MPAISWLLTKGFFWRMREKYVIRDFHPLVFFYVLGFLMTGVGLALGAIVSALRIFGDREITTPTIVLVALLLISGSQFMLFAMWFDMDTNTTSAGEDDAVPTSAVASSAVANPLARIRHVRRSQELVSE